MSDTKYNIEINFTGKKWEYVGQWSTLEWAIKMVNKPYYSNHGPIRIRKVVKTIIWKSKKEKI